MLMHAYKCIDMEFMVNVYIYIYNYIYIYIYIYNYPCVDNVACSSYLHIT